MLRELTITSEPIDETLLTARRSLGGGSTGAVVSFTGVVRNLESGHSIQALEYEAFQKMAEHQFSLLFDQIEKRWPVQSIRLIHRTGIVKINEPSLWVEVLAPHRAEAFAACEWLIDEMKRVVPIWKKQIV